MNNERVHFRDMVTGILALVGGVTIFAGALPREEFDLDVGAHIELVRKSWWGLKETYHRVRLQHFDDWKAGKPYRELRGFDEYRWFIQGENGDWSPIDFVGPLTD